MFNELYKIKYFEKDVQDRLKFNVLLDFMSDVATHNADMMHIGYNDISDKNYAWFLLKYAIEFYEYPANLTEINISTQSRGANKLFAYRDFLISNNSGKIFGKAFSLWGLIDLDNKKMLNINDVFGNYISEYKKTNADLPFEKIQQNINYTLNKEFEANYYDIDINKHVNNTCFARWALETLTVEFLNNHSLKKVNIIFKQEVKLNERVISNAEINNNTTVHSLHSADTNEVLALFMFEWN